VAIHYESALWPNEARRRRSAASTSAAPSAPRVRARRVIA
jgi:hypothetical protein